MKPSDIDKVEDAGMMNGQKVKLLRGKGGLWLATGILKGQQAPSVLGAASHPAILKFNLEKQYPEFQPSMLKSESFNDALVDKHSHFLSNDLRKSGHDVYSVQNGPSVEFHVTKHNVKVSTINGSIVNDALVVTELNMDKKFSRALAGAATEKAISCNVSKIKVGQS